MDNLDLLFEAPKRSRVPKISGMDYRDYLALAIFSDALVDVASKEAPSIHERIVQPGKDLVQSVQDLFDSENVDIWKYADRAEAFKFLDVLNDEWGDSLKYSDIVKFDVDDAVAVALNALGHDVGVKQRTSEFLANQGVSVPSVDLSADSARYVGAYKAIDRLTGGRVQESKESASPHLDRARHELFLAGRKLPVAKRQELDRILSSLEALIGGIL